MGKMCFKKALASIFALLVLGVFLSVAHPVAAEAATVKLTKKHFAFYAAKDNNVAFVLALPYNNIQAEIALYENGRKVGTTTGSNYGIIHYSLKKNKVYFYRVRPIYNGKYIGPWSARRAFSTIKLKLQQKYSGTMTLRVTVPKIAGVKSVTVQLSSVSSTSGFKNWKTLKPGKARACRSINGAKFVYNKAYYVRAKVKLKNGITCDLVNPQGFYFYEKQS